MNVSPQRSVVGREPAASVMSGNGGPWIRPVMGSHLIFSDFPNALSYFFLPACYLDRHIGGRREIRKRV